MLVAVAIVDNEREAEWDCRATEGGSSNLHLIILVSGGAISLLFFVGDANRYARLLGLQSPCVQPAHLRS